MLGESIVQRLQARLDRVRGIAGNAELKLMEDDPRGSIGKADVLPDMVVSW